MPGRDIEILLKARDDASAKIAALESRINQMTASAARGGEKLDKALSFGVALGALEIAGKGVRAISTYLETSGSNADKLAATLESLPGLIGEASKLGGSIGRWISGPTEKEMQAELAAQAAANKRNQDKLDADKKAKEKARLDEQFRAFQDSQESAAKLAETADAKEKERLDAQLAGFEAAQAAADAKFKADRQNANSLMDLDSEILQNKLRAAGKVEEAEREGIRRNYEARVQAARDAGNEEAAVRLETLRDQELAAVGKGKTKDTTEFGGIAAVESRTATYAVGFQSRTMQLAQQQTKHLADIIKGVGSLGGIMERVLAKLPNYV
jgi:hypothetical protein